MGSTRKTRNYKERSSMLAFGHFILPIAAIVALGLLFMGIKLFFLTPADRGGTNAPADVTITRSDPPVTPTDTTVPGDPDGSLQSLTPVPDDAPGQVGQNARPGIEGNESALLAGPIDSSSSGGRTQTERTTPPQSQSRPPATQQKPSGTKVSSSAKWGVQIGAFKSLQGAEALAEQVGKEGYTAGVSTFKSSSGTTFYRVRVAAGNAKEDASKLAAELEKKGHPVLVVSN